MSKSSNDLEEKAGRTWAYITDCATLETKKIVEQNEQIIAELKSISENIKYIATIIQTRFGELEQSQ